MLQQVLDDACQWLTGQDGTKPDEQTRTAIALRIIECAKSGETDPAKIRAHALADLTEIMGDPQESSNA
jgi:hypothetical protein